jgi:hypothetical protein
MSYLGQSQLESDGDFQRRVYAVDTQQAETFKDDGRADIAACARAVLRGDPGIGATFTRMAAGGPGIADKVETGDGIDQSLVTDEDLLALTQANFPTVASLYFAADGSPIEGAAIWVQ